MHKDIQNKLKEIVDEVGLLNYIKISLDLTKFESRLKKILSFPII